MFEQKFIKKSVVLFDNQKNNVRALIHRKRALLTDRVGSGKSLSVLYAFAFLKEKNAVDNLLVLTPLSADSKLVWKKDIDKFTLLRSIHIEQLYKLVGKDVNKLKLALSNYDVIYGKHTHCKIYHDFIKFILLNSRTIFCLDEIHAFKNPKSSLTLACKDIASVVKCFWGITGSTVSKSLEDFYNIANLIYPWYFGSFFEFRSNYCTTKEKVIGFVNGRRKTATVITGISDELAFKQKIEPLVISGESFLKVKFSYLDYKLSVFEEELYKKIARGVGLSPELSQEDWIRLIINGPTEEVPRIKEVDLYSSRFIYLQAAADGILNSDGSLNRKDSTKMRILIDKLKEITNKGQSCIVYFDFYSSLNIAKELIKDSYMHVKVLESSGTHVLKEGEVTEASCKQIPHIILGTKASSESVSYYFINNVIVFQVPTTPSTLTQLIGRITRKNTLYPEDLNCYIFRSNNIDLYKLMNVSAKAYQMELVQGEECNIPSDYKQLMSKSDLLEKQKKILLWNQH